MDPIVSEIAKQVVSTGNLALTILFAGCVYLARQLAKERNAREAADKADRAFAEQHTEVLRSIVSVLGEIKGLVSGMRADR